jgi:hypothetical protein
MTPTRYPPGHSGGPARLRPDAFKRFAEWQRWVRQTEYRPRHELWADGLSSRLTFSTQREMLRSSDGESPSPTVQP